MSRIRGGVGFLFWFSFCVTASAQSFTQAQVDVYRRSVVRVDATRCSGVQGGLLVGSGFFWKQSDRVVTALHVINGCQGLSVYSDVAHDSASARVIKILYAEDLALLLLDKSIPGTSVLSNAANAPQDTQDLLLVGFPGDSSGSTGKTIKRQFGGGNTLAAIASYQDKKELSLSPSPDVNIQVILLQAILEHGVSGGPILTENGNVVGIADGGLKHGTTEDSWAIPSMELAPLEASTDALAKMAAQRSTLLFAATPMQTVGPTVQCGGGTFKHLKTVGYADVLPTADDPTGLQQLVAAAAVDPSTLKFEVYQDDATGATIVLPSGEALSADASTCFALSAGGGVVTRARVEDATGDMYGQKASLLFETQVMGLPQGWILAQAFSYLQPLPITGGGLSRRKDWVHYPPLPGNPQQLNLQQFDAQQFETLAWRGSVLLGVTAQNKRWTPLVVQTQQACRVNANISPFCPQALQDFKDWIENTLAVHLSTLAGT